jgi:type II secretory pathway pseudopilin PulG
MNKNTTALRAKALKKLRSNGAFTMVELLIVIVIMTIAGIIITGTVDLALKHYDRLMQESDAQLLCSSASVFVQNELTYAGKVTVATDNKSVSFVDHANDLGNNCTLTTTADGKILVNYTAEGAAKTYSPIGEGSYGGDGQHKSLTVTPEFRDVGNGVIGVTITVNGRNGVQLTENTFRVKPVAP